VKRNIWLQLAAPAGAFALLAVIVLAAPSPAFAEDNVVRIDPSGVEVAPGGSFTVALIDDPTPASTAIWAIDVAFDPGVITVGDPDRDCDSINTPPGAIGAFDCRTIDANSDGSLDTVKVLGVVLFTGTQTGLVNESTLADIKFAAIGDPGECSDLRLRIRSHADKDGNETGARVQDGRVCIQSDAPPSGTESPVPVTPRTSEPTEPAGAGQTVGVPTLPGSQQSSSPGQTQPSDQPGGGGGSLSPSGRTSVPIGDPDDPEDDGGTSPFVWIAAGLIVAVLAAGIAWSLVRLRGFKPPADSPPN